MWLLLLVGIGVAGLVLAKKAEAKETDEGGRPLLPGGGGLPDVLTQPPATDGQAQGEALAAAQAAVSAALGAAADVAQKVARGDTSGARQSCDAAIASAQEAASAAQQAGPAAFTMYQQAYNALVKACASIGEPTPTPTALPTPQQVQQTPPATDIVVRSPGIPQVHLEPPVPDVSLPGATAPPAPKGSGLPASETSIESDPNGTIALARLLLSRETTSGWKGAHVEEVRTWQGKRNLKTDGKFGPMSAETMAQEVGVLPLVRYWSTGAGKVAELNKYRSFLRDMANAIENQRPDDKPHAIALRLSADREDARSYGNDNPAPVGSASVEQLLAQLQRVALGGAA